MAQMDTDELVELAHEVGADSIISWELGFISEDRIRELFCDADVLALAYRDADGSGVMSQAFGFGLPVVASALPSFAEVIEDGGSGLLFDTDDHVGMARCIERLASEPSLVNMMARRQRDLAEKYAWPSVGRETASFYRHLVSSSAND